MRIVGKAIRRDDGQDESADGLRQCLAQYYRGELGGAIPPARAWLDEHVLPAFAGRVLPIDIVEDFAPTGVALLNPWQWEAC